MIGQRSEAVIWFAWVDGGCSPHICVRWSTIAQKAISQMRTAILKYTERNSQKNARQSWVFDIRRYCTFH